MDCVDMVVYLRIAVMSHLFTESILEGMSSRIHLSSYFAHISQSNPSFYVTAGGRDVTARSADAPLSRATGDAARSLSSVVLLCKFMNLKIQDNVGVFLSAHRVLSRSRFWHRAKLRWKWSLPAARPPAS